jgi:hypothetical protein
MSNLRDDQKAAEIVARYAEEELSGDLALRTYTTRLPGGGWRRYCCWRVAMRDEEFAGT